MKIGRLFPDLLTTLGRAASPEAGFAFTLRRLVALSGATAGGLVFRPVGRPRVLRDRRGRAGAPRSTRGSGSTWPSRCGPPRSAG